MSLFMALELTFFSAKQYSIVRMWQLFTHSPTERHLVAYKIWQ